MEKHTPNKTKRMNLTIPQTLSSIFLQKKMKKHVPTTTKSNKMLTLNYKTWISRAIKRSYKIRNKIYKQYCKEKDQAKKTFPGTF